MESGFSTITFPVRDMLMLVFVVISEFVLVSDYMTGADLS